MKGKFLFGLDFLCFLKKVNNVNIGESFAFFKIIIIIEIEFLEYIYPAD
jgi:hypothetical protein